MGVADVDAEHFAVALGGDPRRDHDCSADDLAQSVIADVDVGGVEIHVRELDVAEGAVPERADAFVEAGTDPGDFGLGDAGVDAHRRDEIIDRPSRHPRHVGLHHHRIQRLVDTTTRLQNGREERALAQFRDAELQVTGLGRQRLGPVAVTFRHASLDAFITAGADRLDGFGLDQLLKHPAGDLTDQVDAFADADRVEKIRQVRIGQSHRCVLLDVVLAGTHQESRRWLTYRWTSKPTTSRGAVLGFTDSVVIPKGAEPCAWSDDEFGSVLSFMEQMGLAANGGDGLTVEFPFTSSMPAMVQAALDAHPGGQTALYVQKTNSPHPGYGNGLFSRLQLPLSVDPETDRKLTNALNKAELVGFTGTPAWGAWCTGGTSGGVNHVAFLPNLMHRPGLVETVSYYDYMRSQWAQEQLLPDELVRDVRAGRR